MADTEFRISRVGLDAPKALRCALNGLPSTPQNATPHRNLNSQDFDGTNAKLSCFRKVLDKMDKIIMDFLQKIRTDTSKDAFVLLFFGRDWDKLVPLFLLSYRSSQHESTTYTPSMLTSGREMKLPTDPMLGRPLEENQERSLPEFVEDLRERMDRIHRFAREKLKIHSDKMKQRLDTASTETAFKPGEAVWLYAPKRTKGKSPKLQSNWESPYAIIMKINNLVYRIKFAISKKQAEGVPSGETRKIYRT
ncbi:hypothetical protein NQ318_005634 [Aromia moschata]|uniref:Reverse transcriptase n=1 Tax=Aromia moschata TaxID=1265417 RepID=A0AAV8Y0F6_9CUCU|nr:hypothetical protein NQ318_005634 [Aromia moschata]